MITSRGNAWFKRLRKAIRDHDHEIVIEGPKAVRDAIAAGWKPIAVCTTEDSGPHPSGQPKTTVLHVSRELFRAVADTATSQGVIGLFERPHWSAEQIFARRDSIAIALDGVQDPGNVGTIVRLGAAFDVSGVILLPGCADPFGPKAIRASAGAILHVPVVPMAYDALLSSYLELYVADAEANEQQPPARGAVMIFGGEGSGVSPALRNLAKGVAVATSGRVESLNVAAAAAILLWRSYRSRKA